MGIEVGGKRDIVFSVRRVGLVTSENLSQLVSGCTRFAGPGSVWYRDTRSGLSLRHLSVQRQGLYLRSKNFSLGEFRSLGLALHYLCPEAGRVYSKQEMQVWGLMKWELKFGRNVCHCFLCSEAGVVHLCQVFCP